MKLNFKNQGGSTILYVNVIGKEDAEGWIKAMVGFNDYGFSAVFKISLMINELYAFVDKLKLFQNSLTGISFTNIEDNINVILSGDGLGHVEIKGMLQHTVDPNLKILFVINSDQTFLPELIRECDEILQHYQPK